ncbi:hypothetical protein [Priestia megaterium]|uniref:hypothetical protein n=1 Tax=Priestia megaterium TaxID=1404 RepID=UPI001C227844|nr:hypothetical protein [Priestia megaterium]MBU8852746.1 hypothetical protein [Bacillus sp. FJAT-26377]MCU7738862.1 hypothetical protein [Priestia megaterium]
MIKIHISDEKIKDIKKKHLEYFENNDPYRNNRSFLLELTEYYNSSTGEEKAYFKYLLDNYETILTGNPDTLQNKIIKKIFLLFSQSLTDEISNPKKSLHQKTINVFNYTSFSGRSPNRWGAFKLIENIELDVCPYCNRQYLTTIVKKKGYVKATLDHFWNKARYPFLAISLFNLIPCCSICNSSFKGEEDFNITKNIHPYVEGFESFGKFELDIGEKPKIEDLIGNDNDKLSFKVVPRDENNKKADEYINFFELQKVYGIHKEHVRELVQKSLIYKESYVNYLIDEYENLFKDKSDIQKMILGTYVNSNDISKRTLSKFTRDIAIELELLKTTEN